MRHALEPIGNADFDRLIDRTPGNRRLMKFKRQIPALAGRQIADSRWRDPVFLLADAIVLVALDALVEAGAKREALGYAFPDVQAAILESLPALDAGEGRELAFGTDGASFAVVATPTLRQAVAGIVEHFAGRGVVEAGRLAVHAIELVEVLATIRDRANRAGIALPERLWPSLCELDAMADLLAEYVPEGSPVASLWRALRSNEAEAAALRVVGGLS